MNWLRGGPVPPGLGKIAFAVRALLRFGPARLTGLSFSLGGMIGLGLLSGTGAVWASDAVRACNINPEAGVPVHRVSEELLFEAADGTVFLPSELRTPEVAGKRKAELNEPGKLPDPGAVAVPIGPADRWARVPAWIVLQQEGSVELWQIRQLEQGDAFFAPLHAQADCAEALRLAERRARAQGKGLWQGGGAGLTYRTERPETWEDAAGRYVIARGRVVSLGKTRSTRYLNFGRYWKTDVTGTVRVSDEDDFNAALGLEGWNLDTLTGHFVELRGVVVFKDGPHIALRNPEQLVVLEDKRAGRDGQGNN